MLPLPRVEAMSRMIHGETVHGRSEEGYRSPSGGEDQLPRITRPVRLKPEGEEESLPILGHAP